MSVDRNVRLSILLPAIADALTEALDDIKGEHTLFAIFIFGDGEPKSQGQYIANCDRDDVAKALRQLLDRWEQTGGDDGPLHIRKAH